MSKAVSAAEREANAIERISEKRQQLAAVQTRMAQSQQALDALASMEQSAAAAVSAAERALDVAAGAVVDAHANALVAVGTDETTSAQAAHGAAVDFRTAARARLDEARAAQGQTRQKAASESEAIRRQLAQDDEARRDLTRLIQSMERTRSEAHKEVVQENRRQAVHEICGAYVAYLDALEKWRAHPEAVEVWHEGRYLPGVLTNSQMTAANIHAILTELGSSAKYRGILVAARANIQTFVDAVDRNAAFEASRKPQASAIAE